MKKLNLAFTYNFEREYLWPDNKKAPIIFYSNYYIY